MGNGEETYARILSRSAKGICISVFSAASLMDGVDRQIIFAVELC